MATLVENEPLGLGPPESSGGLAAGVPYGEPREPERQSANPLELLWRARWLMLLGGLLGGVAAWVQLQRVTPQFTSSSVIYVERGLPRLLNDQISVGGQAQSYLHTQAEIMRSTAVVAAALELPETQGLKCLQEVASPVDLLRYKLSVKVGNPTELITVALEMPNPEEAAVLVNAVVDAYISKYADDRKSDTVEVLRILRADKERRDAEVAERRQALEEFRRAHPELAVQVRNENIAASRFSLLSEELDQTMLQLLDAQALHQSVQRMRDAPAMLPQLFAMARGSDGESSPQGRLREAGIDVVRRQMEMTELQLMDELSRWGEGHRRVKTLRQTLAAFEARLAAKEAAATEDYAAEQQRVVDAYVQSLEQECELLQQKHDQLEKSFAAQLQEAKQVSSLALDLASLEESLDAAERTNAVIDERIKEVNLTEDVGAMNVSIMEVAKPNFLPTYPKRSQFLFLGLTLGGMGGFGIAWLRDLVDQRMRSMDEVAQVLQVPVLGAIQQQEGRRGKVNAGRIVQESPRSVAAEEFRTLRTAIHFGLAGEDCKTLAITSPQPGDGKSTTASNLALANAQAGHRTLIVDADMRKPTQHKIFGQTPERGLSSVLLGEAALEQAILSTTAERLDLLPCGPLPSNPVELLTGGAFAELLRELDGIYDKVILDCPPVLPVADARILASLADATLLVLRAERSTRRLGLAARNELLQVRTQRLGVIVNGVSLKQQANYRGYSYGYRYYRYGYGYGGYGAYGENPERQPALQRS